MAGTRKTPPGGGKSSGTGTRTASRPGGAPVKLVEPAPKPDMTVVTPAEPVVAKRQLKKVEFLERVIAATGMKKKDVKPVVEATLAELDKVIGEGIDLQAPELGKLMIHKRKDVPKGEMVMLKLRRKTATKALAEDDDNG